jgi:hypothetical protein
MKRTAKKVKDILENLDWQAEQLLPNAVWRHPDKWNTADELRCTTTLEATEFDIEVIEEYIDIVLEEAFVEYRHLESEMTFHMLLATYVADYVAWDVIRKSNGDLYAPKSATFTLKH